MKNKVLTSIICLLALMVCSSCAKNEPINFTSINSFTVDMSGYEGMNSINHNFEGITPEEFIKVYNDKGSGCFYIGFENCGYCQEMVKYINQAAKNTNSKIYYIDAYSDLYPLSDFYNEIYEILYPVLLDGKDGEKVIKTPHFFTLINGEISSSKIGVYNDSEEKIIKNYEKMINSLK